MRIQIGESKLFFDIEGANPPPTVQDAHGENRTYNLLPDLGRIRCPTLILAGEDDPILPPEDSEDIAGAIPAQFVRFERFPNPVAASRISAQGLRDFTETVMPLMR